MLSKYMCTYICLLYIILLKRLFSIQFKNNKIFTTPYCKMPCSQWILTKCFGWILPNSSIPSQPKIEIDKQVSLWQKCWLIFSFKSVNKMKVKEQRYVRAFAALLVMRVTSLLNCVIVFKYQENMSSFVCIFTMHL